MDGFGFTEVFVVARGKQYGVYWGRQRDDINVSAKVSGDCSSVIAACHAISQAHDLGISKLSVIINKCILSHDYIMNLTKWKNRNWITSNGELIPQASHLKALDQCLQKYKDVAVKITAMVATECDGLKRVDTLID